MDSNKTAASAKVETTRAELIKGLGGLNNRTLKSFSLDGNVAVITGGAQGLGLAMAQALFTSGADLAIIDLDHEEAQRQADAMLELFRQENPSAQRIPKITTHHADVSSSASINIAIDSILSAHGKIDNLVACAGYCENIPAISYPEERINRLWGVNVNGQYFACIAVAKHFMQRKKRGTIVNIGSISGSIVNVPQPQAIYNASKAAVRHLSASLAVEWAADGIRVNCISPGYMLTAAAMSAPLLVKNPELKEQWEALIPQGKMGEPEDLMGAVVFLSSEASKYITGIEIKVDGGFTST